MYQWFEKKLQQEQITLASVKNTHLYKTLEWFLLKAGFLAPQE